MFIEQFATQILNSSGTFFCWIDTSYYCRFFSIRMPVFSQLFTPMYIISIFHFTGVIPFPFILKDLGTPSLSAFGTLTVNVDDVQDLGPLFINLPYDITIPETQQLVSFSMCFCQCHLWLYLKKVNQFFTRIYAQRHSPCLTITISSNNGYVNGNLACWPWLRKQIFLFLMSYHVHCIKNEVQMAFCCCFLIAMLPNES